MGMISELLKKRKNTFYAVLFSLAYLFVPLVIANTYQLTTMALVLLYAVLLSGLLVIMGYAGQISLAHGAVYGLGAYTSAILTTKYGLPFVIGFFCAGISGLLFSLLIGLPSLRLKGHYLAMATLGFGEIMLILFQELSSLTGGTGGLVGVPPAQLLGLEFSDPVRNFYFILVMSSILLIGTALLIDSRIGRALKAIKDSEVAASALGLNPTFYKMLVFVFAGTTAGFAGSLYAHLDRFVSPSTFSVSFSVMLVAMVIVGGESSIAGSLLAAILFGFLNEYIRQFQELSQLIFGAALLIAVLYFPGGISGTLPLLLKRAVFLTKIHKYKEDEL
jgi:branched-chain amino acid transport system permease protein